MEVGEELPPGMPSATGPILCWLRAISSASVRAAEVDPLQSAGALLFFRFANMEENVTLIFSKRYFEDTYILMHFA